MAFAIVTKHSIQVARKLLSAACFLWISRFLFGRFGGCLRLGWHGAYFLKDVCFCGRSSQLLTDVWAAPACSRFVALTEVSGILFAHVKSAAVRKMGLRKVVIEYLCYSNMWWLLTLQMLQSVVIKLQMVTHSEILGKSGVRVCNWNEHMTLVLSLWTAASRKRRVHQTSA